MRTTPGAGLESHATADPGTRCGLDDSPSLHPWVRPVIRGSSFRQVPLTRLGTQLFRRLIQRFGGSVGGFVHVPEGSHFGRVKTEDLTYVPHANALVMQ